MAALVVPGLLPAAGSDWPIGEDGGDWANAAPMYKMPAAANMVLKNFMSFPRQIIGLRTIGLWITLVLVAQIFAIIEANAQTDNSFEARKQAAYGRFQRGDLYGAAENLLALANETK